MELDEYGNLLWRNRNYDNILEEKGIEKGSNPEHIEAAILSYRNGIAKEIIDQMKEKDENDENETMKNEILNVGLKASLNNNNIRGAELIN